MNAKHSNWLNIILRAALIPLLLALLVMLRVVGVPAPLSGPIAALMGVVALYTINRKFPFNW